MKPDLATRLKLIRSSLPQKPTNAQSDADTTRKLTGWEKIGTYTHRRVRSFPLDRSEFPPVSYLFPSGWNGGQILFFDAETTGLSGGAGNIVFLLGIGNLTETALNVEQYFLSDFPGEREFLSFIGPQFAREANFVSFNGKAFDYHILKNRFFLAGMDFALYRHTDLLYPARMLWKRVVGSCSLGELERHVLGIARAQDIPGWMVPEVYFRFLRSGPSSELFSVFEHNLEDIRSLVQLALLIDAVILFPEHTDAVDTRNLGKFLLSRNAEAGEKILLEAYGGGDFAAGAELGKYYKASRRYKEAVHIWESMAEMNCSLYALTELAKHYEHREKKPGKALELVRRIIESGLVSAESSEEDLKRRMKRLRRKLGLTMSEGNVPGADL